MEQLKLLHIAGGQKKIHALWKTVWQFLIHLSIYVSSESVVLLLGISPWEIITCVYRKIYMWILILNCPKLETTQMPFNWQLDKQTIAYWHNEILHKIKKKWSIPLTDLSVNYTAAGRISELKERCTGMNDPKWNTKEKRIGRRNGKSYGMI